jgi:hypothetical protein
LLEYSEYILKRAEEESEEEDATATQAGTSEEEEVEVTTLAGAAELKEDESDDSAATTDLGLGSFLSLDAPSADEETAGVVEETAAEESAESVEVFVLTIVFDYTHISSVFLSIF